MALLSATLLAATLHAQDPSSIPSTPEAPLHSTEPSTEPSNGPELIKGAPDLTAPLPKSAPEMAGEGEAMPVDWSMVLDLARASSVEVQLSMEKVHESNVLMQLAKLQWIPSMKVGTSWYNSSGRRQDIPGDVIEAAKSNLYAGALGNMSLDVKKICLDILRAKQQISTRNGELDRVTRAEVQKVSNAYVDLVASQAGAAISAEVAQLVGDLVERSRLLLEQGLLTEVNVLNKERVLQAQLQNASKARAAQLAASAQLVMLLNLEPQTKLVASWDHLAPIVLVDENQDELELMTKARSQGPGMSEIAAVLQAIEEQQRKSRQVALIPVFVAQTGYGAFGGAQGSDLLNFGGRFDTNVGAYWDVMDIVGTKQTRELAFSKKRQAMLEHEKLEGKLAAGVRIARYRAIEARKRISSAEKEIDLAIRAYSQSKKRMDADVAPNREIDLGLVEVLPSISALASSRGSYLEAVIEYNKAQIELMYLTGQHLAPSHYHQPACVPKRYVNGRLVTDSTVQEALAQDEQTGTPAPTNSSAPLNPASAIELAEPPAMIPPPRPVPSAEPADRADPSFGLPPIPAAEEPAAGLLPVEEVSDSVHPLNPQ
ncbi:TolC family protein [bacterium]|jgi:outer membrane protein TolC|nr:TolC family protein [bacterium]